MIIICTSEKCKSFHYFIRALFFRKFNTQILWISSKIVPICNRFPKTLSDFKSKRFLNEVKLFRQNFGNIFSSSSPLRRRRSTFFVACVEMENGGQNYYCFRIADDNQSAKTKVQEPPKFDRARRKLVVLNQATIICRE